MSFDDLLDADISGTSPFANAEEASKGLRFANYFLDLVAAILLGIVLFVILLFLFPETAILDGWLMSDDNPLSDYILNAILILIYYPMTEGLLKGKSLAKFITKTRAVQQDGNYVTMKDVFLRTLTRLVPFEHFSFLGDKSRGWHDKWTDTKVIKE